MSVKSQQDLISKDAQDLLNTFSPMTKRIKLKSQFWARLNDYEKLYANERQWPLHYLYLLTGAYLQNNSSLINVLTSTLPIKEKEPVSIKEKFVNLFKKNHEESFDNSYDNPINAYFRDLLTIFAAAPKDKKSQAHYLNFLGDLRKAHNTGLEFLEIQLAEYESGLIKTDQLSNYKLYKLYLVLCEIFYENFTDKYNLSSLMPKPSEVIHIENANKPQGILSKIAAL